MPKSPSSLYFAKEGYHPFRHGGQFEIFWNGPVWNGPGVHHLVNSEGQPEPAGWYWWPCQPGCLPDGEPTGPFTSSSAAYADARG